MIKETITHTLVLPERQTSINVSLTFTVDCVKSQEVDLEVGVKPSLIPPDFIDPIWSDIRAGVNAAVWDNESILDVLAIKVFILDIQISEPLTKFTHQEVILFSNELRIILQKQLSLKLSECQNALTEN